MGVLGKLKNQTTKHKYTIVIINDDGFVVDRKEVEAENPREALRIAYANIFDQ